METLLVILIVVVWISLYSHISKMNSHTDSLRKDLYSLRKYIEIQLEELKKQQAAMAPVEEKPEEAVVSVPVAEEVVVPVIPVTPVTVVEERTESEQEEPPLPVNIEEKKVVPEPVIKPFGIVKEKKKVDYEKYIGENLFGKIGILVLVVGMGLFVKYAIDKNWINEVFRTVLGFVVGGGLLFLSQRLKKTYRTFSSLLAGGAFAIFYVTVGMAYHYYGLFSQTAAFIILVVLTVFMSLLSVLYNRRELAVIALIGGFIAPFLVSNGMGNYLVLFTYMTILNMGMFGLALYKKWGELPLICFIATYVIMLGYSMVADLDVARNAQLVHLLLFSTLYYLIFLLPVVSVLRTDDKKINQWLVMTVVLNNFLYLFFALWFLRELQLPYNIKGVLTLFIALINGVIAFAVRKRAADKGLLLALLTGMFLTFISLSIPIQLEGTFITLLWATEMVVVLWLFSRFGKPVYAYFTYILFFLTLISYMIDLENALSDGVASSLFVNGTFATGIFTGLAFGVFAWLMERRKASFTTASKISYMPFNAIALLVGCGIIYLSFIVDFCLNITYYPLEESACLAFTSLALLLLLVGLRRRFAIDRYAVVYVIAAGLSVCLFVLLSPIVNEYGDTSLLLLQWGALVVVIIHLFLLARYYYRFFDFRQKRANSMTSFIAIASTVLFAVAVNNMLHLAGWENESSAALSISLSMAGFIQMSLGMRLHLKILRMISLAVFGVVLLKLVIVDLWLLPTVGKIIVFIMLGVILLVLSFLYQKLKRVLFMDNEENLLTKE
ncbi:DUF2339 domain-containing protein [Parabacteroides sp.]|uniref:DUF2339 domain-containing protein n=1 Tax=Parabacteroides sp. TaxID=1869337 RepID=UPI0030803C75